MKKGDIFNARIEDLIYPNIGICRYEDTDIRVKNSIIGQLLKLQINKKRKNKVDARILEIVEPSILENNIHSCSINSKCGGCIYQSINYNDELNIKKNQTIKLFSKYVDIDPIYEGITGTRENFYRNKMEFTFGDEYKDGPTALGLHKKNSHYDIVYPVDCNICHPDFINILNKCLDFVKDSKLPFYHKYRHEGVFRHLLIRRSYFTNEIMIGLSITTQNSIDEELFKNLMLDLNLKGTIKSIYIIYNDSLGDTVDLSNKKLIYGKEHITEKILDLYFNISIDSFFQTNSYGANILYDKIREYAGNPTNLADLYCGTGTISQILSKTVKNVFGVDIVNSAIEDARRNSNLNNITNCNFISSDVYEFLKNNDTGLDKIDTIILDPPRAGVGEKALRKILSYNINRIVYVSCKPSSLCEELPILKEFGYNLIKLSTIDMFPRTANFESVALFVKN